MRFRPKGGLGQTPQKQDRDATQARAEVVSEQGGAEHVFEKRHTQEIDRAENIAAGLPPEGVHEVAASPTPAHIPEKKDFREPKAEIPAHVEEEKAFEPVEIRQPSKGILDSIKNAATTLVKKVQKLIRP
jgi:hypothetical protein